MTTDFWIPGMPSYCSCWEWNGGPFVHHDDETCICKCHGEEWE